MTIASIIVWMLLGALSGWIASKLIGGIGTGLPGTILIGIAGSFLGGWLGSVLKISGATVGGLSLPSIFTAVGGAVVLLFIIKSLRR
ncbi:GlsB/YeaQ/YmgE family stress response membrane protein [uncultured Microscilla sp.]|uniref:GlsB/YeaQ/YmgE family stress response membrane protein n=1 Tax=uncultured Microscilla sp. TaxID=432653 RepID=UPI002624B403|nr:GlsB/YeaQ/YmgE family stress response membrane protein [uncultured Microscilla sp.]